MKMKRLIILSIALNAYISSNAQAELASTEAIIKQACKEAGEQRKNAFIIFHASWCIWCHKLDSSMNDASCKNLFNNNYVIKHITVFETDNKKKLNNPGGEAFLKTHYANDQGIPAWFIFDSSGNLLADSQLRPPGSKLNTEGSNVGCPANETEINYFMHVLENTSQISNEEKEAVKKRFAKNQEP